MTSRSTEATGFNIDNVIHVRDLGEWEEHDRFTEALSEDIARLLSVFDGSLVKQVAAKASEVDSYYSSVNLPPTVNLTIRQRLGLTEMEVALSQVLGLLGRKGTVGGSAHGLAAAVVDGLQYLGRDKSPSWLESIDRLSYVGCEAPDGYSSVELFFAELTYRSVLGIAADRHTPDQVLSSTRAKVAELLGAGK